VFKPNATPPHRGLPDLKDDILIDGNGNARITDFSLVTMASDQSTTSHTFREDGTLRWMSPELLYPERFGFKDSRPTKESDCYALGMVIYEVLAGLKPFVQNGDSVVRWKVRDGKRPSRPQGDGGRLLTDDIWDILELCWKHQPCNRISASVVLLRLERHPPLLMPHSNADGYLETSSDDQWDVETTASDCTFSPLHHGLIFDFPSAILDR
jgi:serine/threonine protein kinase